MDSNPTFGVIVGRFQVHRLHEAHLELFRIVSSRHKRVIVFLGVAPTGPTRRNPLDFGTRRHMVNALFPEFTVLPIPDRMLDSVWSEDLDERIRDVAPYGDVTLYGGRDCFAGHYTGSHKPVELAISMPPSGTEVRAQLADTVIASSDFRAGIIHCTHNMYPRVITCVDVAIIHEEHGGSYELLLGRKADESQWRFIGGHADPASDNFEKDARREVMEETGLDLIDLQYLGSHRVDDWRWSAERDKIKTLFFVGMVMSAGARAHDDIAEVRWFKPAQLSETLVVPAHRRLMSMFLLHLKLKASKKDALEPAAANG